MPNNNEQVHEKACRELQHQVRGLQRAAQEKEDYIERLMTSHLQSLNSLKDQIIQQRTRASVAEAKLARLDQGSDNVELIRLQAKVISLETDNELLACLEASGVDNWEGYDDAKKMMEDDDE